MTAPDTATSPDRVGPTDTDEGAVGDAIARPSVDYLLGLGDDALIMAQRLGEWAAGAPEMEEDVALANIALDQLGAARLLLTYAAELEGAGRDEDALAFLRDDRQFRNCLLVELPNGDFGQTIAKLLILSAYQVPLYRALSRCGDERLAAIAAKAHKESAYHLDHSSLWTVRLGDGTTESHRRMQAAIDAVWPYRGELFSPDPAAPVDPATLRAEFDATVDAVLAEATLQRPGDDWAPAGGRDGLHTEHLSYLLAEMQVVHRAHPGAGERTRRAPDRAWTVAATVVDPEIRAVTIEELGILREVAEDPETGRVVVTITPTYTGCPAMDVIRADIRAALAAAGSIQCHAWAATTASALAAGRPVASPVPGTARTRPPVPAATSRSRTARIDADGSRAVTVRTRSAGRAASSRVNSPVPAPSSTTSAPSAMPARTRSTTAAG